MAPEPPIGELRFPDLPDAVRRVLATIADAGHEVALVGGSVRDPLLGIRHTGDWDAASSARPEEVAALFRDASWENRFGTVTVAGPPAVEVTSYRAEGAYRDRRRPDDVRFGVSLEEDLARRDFTINAIAWVPVDLAAGAGTLHDPFDGRADLAARLLRTVGDPRARFEEDALRLVRAARFAGRFGMTIDPATEAAAAELAPTVAAVSGERIRDELMRILEDDPKPSTALGIVERLGILSVILPELAALRGVPQSKAVPGDALDHTLAAVDAAPPDARLTALLHDIGKATTLADGHFIGHDRVGAELAAQVLHRLRMPAAVAGRVAGAIRHHMYDYEPEWTDAAVRRFIRRTAEVDRRLLFELRRADNAASGVGDIGEANQAELEARIIDQLAGQPDLLMHRRLAIDGHDLQAELGMAPGPEIGAVLDGLVEAVLDDPSLNRRETLLELARDR
ncbi:MAG TPA: CCA tRNA nucleotidyltransferase [Candidatus Limnocylindria bacterium]|nr:CCA tRNA nucleotidyltransferase [Candidatus Limnocylindria bacterium]